MNKFYQNASRLIHKYLSVYRFADGYATSQRIEKSWIHLLEPFRDLSDREISNAIDGEDYELRARALVIAALLRLSVENSPIYVLDPGLAAAMILSDGGDALSAVDFRHLPLNQFVIIPPRGLLFREDDRSVPIDSIVVSVEWEIESIDTDRYSGAILVHAYSSEPLGLLAGSAYILREGGTEKKPGMRYTGGADCQPTVDRLLNIAAQCFLILGFTPQYVSEVKPNGSSRGVGFGKSDRRPRLLRLGFDGTVRPAPQLWESGSSHNSKSAHWRRGHWRNQPIGKDRAQSKKIWILPTWIGRSVD